MFLKILITILEVDSVIVDIMIIINLSFDYSVNNEPKKVNVSF